VPRHIRFDAVRPGTVFAERYFVVRPIKAGGMGAVFEVQHTRTHKPLALKVMHPDVVAKKGAREKFEQEAYLGVRIGSTHVVDVTDAGVDETTGLPYLVMELLHGSELAALIEKEGKIEPKQLVEYLVQVARALDKAHQRGIVHRDLKPENIFVTEGEDGKPFVKVLDFGIAKIVEGATREGTDETGTPLYMAPEQTARGQLIDPSTDIWALAIVAYECLVGQTYWRAGSVAEFYRELLFEPLPSPEKRALEDRAKLPVGFDKWFFGAVNREPAQRYKTAGECMAGLAALYGVDLSQRTTTLDPTGGDLKTSPMPTLDAPKGKRPTPAKSPSQPNDSQASAEIVTAARSIDSTMPARGHDLDDEPDPNFGGNRRKILAVLFVLLLVGGIVGVVVAARNAANQVPPSPSGSTPIATTSAPIDQGPAPSVEEALKRARPKKIVCQNQALVRNPKLKGTITVEFHVSDGGTVFDAKVINSTLGDGAADQCILDVIRNIRVVANAVDGGFVFTDTTDLS